MATYYVNSNAQPNGDHEVHLQGCAWMPSPENRIYLGNHHSSCVTAVAAARAYYWQSNGCYWCSNPCHTG